MPQRLFLIDGSSQMYRAYHAMRGSGLTGPGGRSTHAVYIFVTMLRKLIQDHHPQYIAASFDLPGRTFRDDLAADYKANRTPMPGTPLMLSIESPISARTSTTWCGATPNLSLTPSSSYHVPSSRGL